MKKRESVLSNLEGKKAMKCVRRNKFKGAILIETLVAMFLLLFGIIGFLYGMNVVTKTQVAMEDGDYLALGTDDFIESIKIQAAVRARSNPIDAYAGIRNPNDFVNGVLSTPIISPTVGCDTSRVGGFFGRESNSFGIADLTMVCDANGGFVTLNSSLNLQANQDYQFIEYNNDLPSAPHGEAANAQMSIVNIGFIPR